MALHKDFPKSPYEILDPKTCWFPADEALREKGYEKLLCPIKAITNKGFSGKLKENAKNGN